MARVRLGLGIGSAIFSRLCSDGRGKRPVKNVPYIPFDSECCHCLFLLSFLFIVRFCMYVFFSFDATILVNKDVCIAMLQFRRYILTPCALRSKPHYGCCNVQTREFLPAVEKTSMCFVLLLIECSIRW